MYIFKVSKFVHFHLTRDSSANSYRYMGQYGYWRDSGLQEYVLARYLNPMTGRWLSVDPVEGQLRYAYALDNPFRYVDPTGTQSFSDILYYMLRPGKSAPEEAYPHNASALQEAHRQDLKRLQEWQDAEISQEIERRRLTAKPASLPFGKLKRGMDAVFHAMSGTVRLVGKKVVASFADKIFDQIITLASHTHWFQKLQGRFAQLRSNPHLPALFLNLLPTSIDGPVVGEYVHGLCEGLADGLADALEGLNPLSFLDQIMGIISWLFNPNLQVFETFLKTFQGLIILSTRPLSSRELDNGARGSAMGLLLAALAVLIASRKIKALIAEREKKVGHPGEKPSKSSADNLDKAIKELPESSVSKVSQNVEKMEEGVRRVEAKVQKMEKTSVKAEKPLEQIVRSGIPDAHPFNILDLSIAPRKEGYYKKFKYPNPDEGILYLLRDKNSGDILKVGLTTIEFEVDPVWQERLRKYRTAANKTHRQLDIVMFAVPPGHKERGLLETWENEVREEMKKAGHPLYWDNTDERLGRPGPGIPFIHNSFMKENNLIWQDETTIIQKIDEKTTRVYWSRFGSR